MSASAVTDSVVLDISVARVMKRDRRSAGIAGRGPYRCAPMYASAFAFACAMGPSFATALRTRVRMAARAARLSFAASLIGPLLDVSANEVGNARHAFF